MSEAALDYGVILQYLLEERERLETAIAAIAPLAGVQIDAPPARKTAAERREAARRPRANWRTRRAPAPADAAEEPAQAAAEAATARPSPALEEPAAAILRALKTGPKSRANLASSTGLATMRLRRAISSLISTGQIRASGKTTARRYALP
jgi:hypothetical protein